jgi:hypothetical protein
VTSLAPGGAAAARQPVIEVRIDAPAGAQVLAAGAGMVVCAAPCTVSIDPADGGSTIRRDFVVHKPGFADHALTIDLTDPPAAVEVALEPLAAAEPTVEPTVESSGHRSRGKKSADGVTATADPGATDPPDPSDDPPITVQAEDPPPPPVTDPSPGKKPRKGPAVDPSKTIDPFAPKK